jgi:beta-lactamase class D
MSHLKDFSIFLFFAVSVSLMVWSKFRSKQKAKEWRSDFEKYQESYRKDTDIDTAIKNSNRRYEERKKD